MKTYLPKVEMSKKNWHIVDAEGKTLGRVAVRIATVLRGKHTPKYTPHLDMGDFVVVINAEKVHVTGKKLSDKVYHHHSGYPGGLKTMPLGRLLEEKPEEALKKAVWGMLPHNRLGRAMFRKLKIYAGASHPHAAQTPKTLNV
jgi:large subunit ribosomal protein L13